MRWPRIEGLYAITPDIADTAALIQMAGQVLVGGARLVQYRSKNANEALRLAQGRLLASLCREFRVPFIVNDHLELAVEVDADGVHLGFDDTPIAHARRRLGTRKIIGASCYNNLEQALEAERQGANYVAFGAFFTSATKPHAVAATKELLREAKALLRIPVVAIGGITARNAMELIDEGADALAVSHAVFAASDVQSEAETLARLFTQRNNLSH